MLLGSEWECADPDDVGSNLSEYLDELLDSLKIERPDGDAIFLPLPFCVQYSAMALFILLMTSIRLKLSCSKAFGLFGYYPDKESVPLHVICWSVHTRADRSLYLQFREPQRSLKLVNLSPTEIKSCVALFAC